ncbi:MAG: hypothetical protein GY953_44865 [bacterium]|nr:hypothetical protein [bacterium]
MNQSAKTAIFWVFLILVVVILWTVVQTGGERPNRTLTFSEFLSEIESGKVKSVEVRGYEFTGIHSEDGLRVRGAGSGELSADLRPDAGGQC